MTHRLLKASLLAATALAFALPAHAQNRVTTPEEQFGHEIGADYELVTYEELHAYWIKLANESDRMVLDTIGYTEEGRPHIQAIITSPENHANLDRYNELTVISGSGFPPWKVITALSVPTLVLMAALWACMEYVTPQLQQTAERQKFQLR